MTVSVYHVYTQLSIHSTCLYLEFLSYISLSLSLSTVCPEGFYQPLVSYSIEDECKPCPSESSADEAGTAVCKCRDGFIRHPDRPDDPCLRKLIVIAIESQLLKSKIMLLS